MKLRILATVLAMVIVPALFALQPLSSGAVRISRLANGRLNVEGNNAHVPDLLEQILTATGRKWTMQVGDYEGNRIVDLKNVSLEEAITSITHESQLRVVQKDGIYIITAVRPPVPAMNTISGALVAQNGVLYVLRNQEIFRYRLKDMKLLGRTKLPN